MSPGTQLAEYVRAGFTVIWIESHEHQNARAEITRRCRQEDWRFATWEIDVGSNVAGGSEETDAGVAIRWLDVRKSLSKEQKSQTADFFGAEGRFLSAG